MRLKARWLVVVVVAVLLGAILILVALRSDDFGPLDSSSDANAGGFDARSSDNIRSNYPKAKLPSDSHARNNTGITEYEDRLFAEYPWGAPVRARRLKLATPDGLNIGSYPLGDVLDLEEGLSIDVPASETELVVALLWDHRDGAEQVIAEVVIQPIFAGDTREWRVKLPSSTVTLVSSQKLDTEWFRVSYENEDIRGTLVEGAPWDGSPISGDVLPGTYTLSGSFDVEGSNHDPPNTMTSRIRFDPPVVEALEGQEVVVEVAVQVYNAWLPVEVGERTIHRVVALRPSGPTISLPEAPPFYPTYLGEVPPYDPDRRWNQIEGWHWTQDGRLYVAPELAGRRRDLGWGPTAVVEFEDGHYAVVDAGETDPLHGGVVLPDSTTAGRAGVDLRVQYDGEGQLQGVKVTVEYVRLRHVVESPTPYGLVFSRKLTLQANESLTIHIPSGYQAWLTRVSARVGDRALHVDQPKRRESIVGKTIGSELVDGTTVVIRLSQ